MVQQNVVVGDLGEQVVVVRASSRGGCGTNGGSRKSLRSDQLHQLVQARHVERAVDLVDFVVAVVALTFVVAVNLFLADEHLQAAPRFMPAEISSRTASVRCRARSRDSIDRSMSSASCSKQVDVHVAGEAERGVIDDVVAAEQIRQPAGDQVFQQHEVLLVVRLDRHEPRQHLRHLHHGKQPLRPDARSPAPASPPGTARGCETAGWDGSGRSPSA